MTTLTAISNFAVSTLASSIDAVQTTIAVAPQSPDRFPATGVFACRIGREIVYVTSRGGGWTWTVVRGQETAMGADAAYPHNAGEGIGHDWTAGSALAFAAGGGVPSGRQVGTIPPLQGGNNLSSDITLALSTGSEGQILTTHSGAAVWADPATAGVGTSRRVNTAGVLQGGGDLSADRTIFIAPGPSGRFLGSSDSSIGWFAIPTGAELLSSEPLVRPASDSIPQWGYGTGVVIPNGALYRVDYAGFEYWLRRQYVGAANGTSVLEAAMPIGASLLHNDAIAANMYLKAHVVSNDPSDSSGARYGYTDWVFQSFRGRTSRTYQILATSNFGLGTPCSVTFDTFKDGNGSPLPNSSNDPTAVWHTFTCNVNATVYWATADVDADFYGRIAWNL